MRRTGFAVWKMQGGAVHSRKYIYLLGVTIQNMLGILDIYWVVGPLGAPNMKGIHVECSHAEQ